MKVFFEELQILYADFAGGRNSSLPELPIQYTDYTHWQREYLQGEVLEKQLAFWRDRLSGLQTLDLPIDKPRPATPSFTGGRESITIAPHLNNALQALCEQASVTPFMALLAAFQMLLHRYTGQDDIAVGCPIANRNRPELEKLIGFFVNTLVMRTDLSGDPTLRETLGRAREVALSAYAHQDTPFERLVEELQPKRDPSRNPLFQVTFQILSDAESKPANGESSLSSFNVELLTSKFDLRCDLWPHGGALNGYIEYSADLFEAETVRSMAVHFERIVAAMVTTPDRRISDIALLSSVEEQKLLRDWNDTACAFTPLGCVHERFEAMARDAPDAVAIAEDAATWVSYGEVNRWANQLARVLKSRGIRRGSLVAVLLDRSIALIVSILAIHKAGAAYIPLDPCYPNERLSLMFREARVPLVLTSDKYRDKISSFVPQFHVDRERSVCEDEDDSNLTARADGSSLAYVIFTSGSTGKPRGVEVTHSGLSNLVAWHQREYKITPEDRATLYASPGFDASVWEIFPYLTAGASLHVPDAETHASPTRLAQWMAETGITISFLPTPVAESFIASELPDSLRLRTLLTGGDKLRRHPQKPLPFRFVNHYGPTENSVVATACEVEAGSEPSSPAIGKPIANVQAYVLDSYAKLIPIGVKGELYLGGAGLARGYLNQSHLTDERFVANPFDRKRGSRLYRTGDLVRHRRDGNLEFHGRVDSQIKLRGYRIEPGEIEVALNEHPRVRESLIVAREDSAGEKTLIAYLTPIQGETAEPNTFEADLQTEHIAEWRDMYEHLYSGGGDERTSDERHEARDPEFDIIGWNSSYTGEPLSRAEMREQVEATVGRIAALRGQRILEIGCGTGLLLLRLAGECERYVGTDFSAAALERVACVVRERSWKHVELYERDAADLTNFDPNSFDVVVLNSVVQYFPDVDYLRRVLEGACRMVRPGGHVFIGDVRSLPLQEMLAAGVEMTRAGAYAGNLSAGELRARIARRLSQETELVLTPDLFQQLPRHLPTITRVAIEVKRGLHHNELSRFRYDVVLETGGRCARSPIHFEERHWRQFCGAAQLAKYLEEQSPPALIVRGVPSRRIGAERSLLAWLARSPPQTIINDSAALRWLTGEADEPDGIEPEELWALAERVPYGVGVTWAQKPDDVNSYDDEAAGGYDVLCVRRAAGEKEKEQTPIVWCAPLSEEGELKPWELYANRLDERHLAHDLRQHLRARVPEYMVPSAFVWLDSLPLTPNGKRDRRALPEPADANRRSSNPIDALPGNEVEAALAEVWREVLGLERVGMHENFFDLGGHSLLLVRVHSKLVQSFKTSLSIVDLFRLPSISALAKAIAAERNDFNAPQAVSGHA